MMIEKALAFVADFRKRFDPMLARHLDEVTRKAAAVDSAGVPIAAVAKNFVANGGKRLRPAFVAIGYAAFSEGDWEPVAPAGIAVELFHAFFLMHDDLMDRSDLRRGLPTVHRVFQEMLAADKARAHDAEHLSNSLAMLAGDLCCALAYDALLEAPFPTERILRALRHMQSTVYATTIGQVLDMLPAAEPQEEQITKIHLLKTARYSVEAPLHLGMILAGAAPADLAAMSQFAIPVGLAYQIQDDVLGVFGSEEEVGKPVTSDLAEGKETLLTVFVRDQGSARQKRALAKLHGNPAITAHNLETARAIFVASGALAHSERRAQQLAAEGKEALAKLTIPLSSRSILSGLADYVTSRRS